MRKRGRDDFLMESDLEGEGRDFNTQGETAQSHGPKK